MQLLDVGQRQRSLQGRVKGFNNVPNPKEEIPVLDFSQSHPEDVRKQHPGKDFSDLRRGPRNTENKDKECCQIFCKKEANAVWPKI